MARERPAWACEQPEVAVCIVGQLRTASRPKLARNLRTAWDRVGADCVDLYLHVGLEDGPFYIQAGPALATGGGESDWGLTGKTGVSGKVSEKMDLYGEVSVAKFDGVDTAYGLKVGTKYKF